MTEQQLNAMKLALESLEKCDSALAEELAAWDIDPPLHHVLEASNACGPAITAIKEVLALVNKVDHEESSGTEQPAQGCGYCNHPLYAGTKCLNCGRVTEQPEQRKPLTNEEIENVWERVQANDFHDCVQPFARAIEAAHGIKGDAC